MASGLNRIWLRVLPVEKSQVSRQHLAGILETLVWVLGESVVLDGVA